MQLLDSTPKIQNVRIRTCDTLINDEVIFQFKLGIYNSEDHLES